MKSGISWRIRERLMQGTHADPELEPTRTHFRTCNRRLQSFGRGGSRHGPRRRAELYGAILRLSALTVVERTFSDERAGRNRDIYGHLPALQVFPRFCSV